MWGRGSFIERIIPEFLKKHSNRAFELWMKFIGDKSIGKLQILNDEYLFKRGENVGFIFGQDIADLSKELYTILPHTNEFYYFLDDYYKESYPVDLRLIEMVYSLCKVGIHDIQTNPVLAYYNDQSSG